MRFWTREIAGWVLLILGLFVFYRCYTLLARDLPPRILEGGSLTVVGAFLFRGGIHLLKVAVAARICEEAQERIERQQTVPTATTLTGRGTQRPLGSTRFS
jgi:hypothetical protein